MADLRNSPLHAEHEKLGASFTAFGPFNMPLKYGKELDEHRAVRNAVGIFDLSHMGEFRVTGPDAGKYLDYTLVSTISTLKVGQAKYTMLVKEDGGILDDLITYRLGEEEFLVIPNAGNIEKDRAAFEARTEGFDVTFKDESFETSLIAVQGPLSEQVLLKVADEADHQAIKDMKYYTCAPVTFAGVKTLLARTGYTGEDGFEVYAPNADASHLWEAFIAAGEPEGILPCGLAARDSLRLEAGMPLYGNELNEDLTPRDAGMGFLLGKDKDDYVGKDAIAAKDKPARLMRGLVGEGKRAARAGATVVDGDTVIGEVTSGQLSPTLGYPVALVYIDREFAEPDTKVEVDIRGKRYPFTVIKGAFYKRDK